MVAGLINAVCTPRVARAANHSKLRSRGWHVHIGTAGVPAAAPGPPPAVDAGRAAEAVAAAIMPYEHRTPNIERRMKSAARALTGVGRVQAGDEDANQLVVLLEQRTEPRWRFHQWDELNQLQAPQCLAQFLQAYL